MGLQLILNQQTDFTGEFPAEYAKDGLWRLNETAPDADTMLADSSGKGRKIYINNWSGTTAVLRDGYKGRYYRVSLLRRLDHPYHLLHRQHLYTDPQHQKRPWTAHFLSFAHFWQAAPHAVQFFWHIASG